MPKTSTTSSRFTSPPWTRDELIIAMDVYLRLNGAHPKASDPEMIELSAVLNALPIHSIDSRGEPHTFRNPNGMVMTMANFRHIDPRFVGTGLSGGSTQMKGVWETFSTDHLRLAEAAQAIRSLAGRTPTTSNPDDSDEESFPEGRLLQREHLQRERSRLLVAKAKELALQRHGSLNCEVCGFNFQAVYGAIGEQYIEAHHRTPVSSLPTSGRTKVTDLALVCANCHRMLHRQRPWLSPEQLRSLISTTSGALK